MKAKIVKEKIENLSEPEKNVIAFIDEVGSAYTQVDDGKTSLRTIVLKLKDRHGKHLFTVLHVEQATELVSAIGESLGKYVHCQEEHKGGLCPDAEIHSKVTPTDDEILH